MLIGMIEGLAAWGYTGFFVLMVLQDVVTPIPSEMVMALAGYSAGRGDLSLPLTIAVCAAGGLAGMSFWFGIGRWLGLTRVRALAERHGRWLTLDGAAIDALDRGLDRYGGWAVAFARIIPAIGGLVALPAGMSGMGWGRFLLCAASGNTLYMALVIGGAHTFGARDLAWVDTVLQVAGPVVGVGLVGLYVWRVMGWKKR